MQFAEWMEIHKDKFTTYSSDEICDVAVACGFDRQEICNWLFKNNGDRRAA